MSSFTLNKQIPFHKNLLKSVISCINILFNSSAKSNSISLDLIVPASIVYRTQLICNYISKEIRCEFGIYDLIMLLYINFIESSTKNYNPMKVLKELSKTYDYDKKIKISDGINVYEYERRDCKKKIVSITMARLDVERGKLLLDELKDLYGYDISINKMIYQIWINFIEGYKKGENNKALKNIINMLKNIDI